MQASGLLWPNVNLYQYDQSLDFKEKFEVFKQLKWVFKLPGRKCKIVSVFPSYGLSIGPLNIEISEWEDQLTKILLHEIKQGNLGLCYNSLWAQQAMDSKLKS